MAELQPCLPGTVAAGRPTPGHLSDLTHPLEIYAAPASLAARIKEHNAKREALLSEALATRERQKQDWPFVQEIDRLTPPAIRQTLTAFGVLAPLGLFYAPTPPLFALVVGALTFLAVVYIVLAVLALVRANVARLLSES